MALMRLDKLLAHSGWGSRKDVKKLIKAGRVAVNGVPADDGGLHVDPENDTVTVDDEPVLYRRYTYLIMNKPSGVITATEDAVLPTVLDLLDAADRAPSLFPVGRLDRDTEGLLLLTNDGQLAHRLLSPKHHVPKRYAVRVRGWVTEEDAARFAAGLVLEDGTRTLPAELTILSAGTVSDCEVTLYEGKFHQIKRMFRVLGKHVVALKRLSMGPLTLDPALSPGMYRPLTDDEVRQLKEAAGLAAD
ncbi:MAG: 16S rRNA pseudouridine(516) synthase [Bacillaceae bacterium G1]|nr:16S rRNA pseudouridine(516) synthase [Bacillota bacterium]OJF17622.1 MAG: 16S rRNA pseudouridine(516) synthase [Bacillaceae bacterium G1]